jgi:phosphoenolpyruvate carboxykinase (ATP)
VWLVNTGWSGGPFGVGKRMRIAHTRAMVTAALDGTLSMAPTTPDPIFKVLVPERCPGVPAEVLQPRTTWPDHWAYDTQANELARKFANNFKQFENKVDPAISAAGPQPV